MKKVIRYVSTGKIKNLMLLSAYELPNVTCVEDIESLLSLKSTAELEQAA